MKHLRVLDLSRNRLRAAPPGLPGALRRLALAETRVRSCAKLEHLAHLRVLDVAGTEVSSVRAFHPLVLCRSVLLEVRVDDLSKREPAWRRKLKDLFPNATVL